VIMPALTSTNTRAPRSMHRSLRLLSQVLVLGAVPTYAAKVFDSSTSADDAAGDRLRTVTWNVAAVNNNPFEYWITHPNPGYKKLMEDVERFIINPGAEDVRIDSLFTNDMFNRVIEKMKAAGVGSSELATVQSMWESNYRSRKIVSEFLKDAEIGSKRLASMPDRVTNTIQLPSGQSVFRPTVINCYSGEIGTMNDWFEQWLRFFFDTTVDLGKGPKQVHSLIQKLSKAKYPAVTEEEEAASKPLQIVLQGIFDAVLVNLMQTKGGSTWQSLRQEICSSLNSRKNEKLLEILRTTYADADIIFLQEAGNQLVKLIKEQMKDTYEVILPKSYSTKRNQNSVMLLRAGLFQNTEEVQIPAAGWEDGDLLVVKARRANTKLTLASFHGDTNGLLTMPMLEAVHKNLPTSRLLFGMDANTYEKVSKKTAHVLEFEKMYQKLGYRACWGKVDPSHYTTFNARTYLQPQLNKAAKSTELAEKGDRNPKDFLLFTDHFTAGKVWRDNTGRGEYDNDIVFPTLDFPSDHAAVAVDVLMSKEAKAEL